MAEVADEFDPIEETKDRLLELLERRDPARKLFRVGNTEAVQDKSRRGVNVRPVGNANEFPVVTVDAGDEASAMYASDDATLSAFGDVDDDGEPGDDPASEEDHAFSHAQDYVCTVVHEGENERLNNRTDRNVVAAWAAGGPKLKDPATPGSSLPYVVSWGYAARRTTEWVGTDVRRVTRFTVTVNMVLRASEIAAIPLPDVARKGEQ